ncbi:hypothetical protein COEREDRAFT_81300 [Coemansia reversa NRRL 1564]|uniref:Uncharacterized protein n=1 Tax=Coemansia reversa (strain ATCC 12441 / NRRL 1564) TaxID=763665 RepID=A0A2G5BBD6_COERN|nr:hypothetical protein COEREDRAFT_81300 [Coemansia reversa NRRL 1564]|eukprot:PIA16325.1 hypothetical protein COEREDRAFT_81300 [Coemansia reversa NRRL 1564]
MFSNDENARPLLEIQSSEKEQMDVTDCCYTQSDIRFLPLPLSIRWDQLVKKWFTEIQHANQQIQALKAELADARKTSHEVALEHEQQREALKSELADSRKTAHEAALVQEQQREALKSELADAHKAALVQEQQHEMLKEELAAARKTLDNAIEEESTIKEMAKDVIDECESRMQGAGRELLALAAKMRKDREAAMEESLQCETVEYDIVDAHETTSRKKERCDAIKAHYAVSREIVAEVQQQHEALIGETMAAFETSVERGRECDKLNAKLTNARKASYEQRQRCKALEIELADAYEDFDELEQQHEALQAELTTAHDVAVKQEEQCKALEIGLAGARKAAIEQKEQCEALEIELAGAREEIVKQRETLEDELDDVLETAIGSEQQCELLETDLADALDEVKELKHNRESPKMAFEKERSANSVSIDDAIRKLDDRMDQADQRRLTLEIKIDDTLKAAVSSKQQYEQLELKLVDVLDEIDELNQQRNAQQMAAGKDRSTNVEFLNNRLLKPNEDLYQARLRCATLMTEIDDSLKAADRSKQQYEQLEFDLNDALDEFEELKQKREALQMSLRMESSSNVESINDIMCKRDEDLHTTDQRYQTLVDALKKAHEDTAEEKSQREKVKHDLADACKAMVEVDRQWTNRWETMKREHHAEIEHLRANTHPKPAEVAHPMSPSSTPRESSGDESPAN